MTTLKLPTGDGGLFEWRPTGVPAPRPGPGGFHSRRAYAAVHVVADPLLEGPADGPPPIDWEATLAYRHYLWDLGLGVAEAMDTAQRGAGLDWDGSRDLIIRTARDAQAIGATAVYGASTDQLARSERYGHTYIIEAYRDQLALIDEVGGQAILMASRHLAATARSADDYIQVYDAILSDLTRPVMIHWLGEMFDPLLAGYWGAVDPWEAMETLVALIEMHPGKVDGVKLSLLDEKLEVALRRRLPGGVLLYTGDDLNYFDLILGDDQGHSHALLGVLDAIAPVAATAFQALDQGETDRYREVLEPTIPLAHHLFAPPTVNYKTGVVFIAYLNGHQSHFRMLGGAEGARSLPHLSRLLVLADGAGLLRDPELALHRMRLVLAMGGLE